MSELGPGARKLVDEVRDLDDPTKDDEARVRSALAAAIAAQGAAIASGTGTAAAASGSGALALKIALAGALVAGATTAVVYTALPSDPASHAAPSAPARVERGAIEAPAIAEPAAEPLEAAVVEPAPEPELPEASVAPRARVRVASPTPPENPRVEAPPPLEVAAPSPPVPEAPDTLAEELVLLRAANRALASDPASALGLLDQHRERFASGQLATDREVVRVLALCALGRSAEARSAAEPIRARLEGTPRGRRLESSCIAGGTP
jgi:hypothetical protein